MMYRYLPAGQTLPNNPQTGLVDLQRLEQDLPQPTAADSAASSLGFYGLIAGTLLVVGGGTYALTGLADPHDQHRLGRAALGGVASVAALLAAGAYAISGALRTG